MFSAVEWQFPKLVAELTDGYQITDATPVRWRETGEPSIREIAQRTHWSGCTLFRIADCRIADLTTAACLPRLSTGGGDFALAMEFTQ
jgi:hypothetical protein